MCTHSMLDFSSETVQALRTLFVVFLSDASSQTLLTSSRPTWRIWRRWSQRLSFTPTTVTCLSIAAAKAPCASVTWEKQRCATNTPNVSKTCWELAWRHDGLLIVLHVLASAINQRILILLLNVFQGTPSMAAGWWSPPLFSGLNRTIELFCTDIDGSQMINPNNFGDPLIFHLAPLSGSDRFWVK